MLRPDSVKSNHNGGPSIFLIVEGANDIQFLRRISAILHIDDPHMPELSAMEHGGELIFVPFGGGDVSLWTDRLAGLGRAEFHLYDREMPPESPSRQIIADAVNRRPQCRAVLTKKRSLENYLSASAIHEAGDVDVNFSDHDPVAELVARQMHKRRNGQPCWNQRQRRSQWPHAGDPNFFERIERNARQRALESLGLIDDQTALDEIEQQTNTLAKRERQRHKKLRFIRRKRILS